MRAHLDLTHGLLVSERLVAAFEPHVGRREARRLVTAASRTAVEQDRPLGAALAEEPALAGLLDADTLRDLLDPARYLGAAVALTDRALRRRPSGAAR